MDIIIKLKKIGLGDPEAKTYLACLENTYNTPLSLSRRTNLNRSAVYLYINTLKEKGLILYRIRGKRKYIVAADPKVVLKNLIEEKKSKLRLQAALTEQLITELHKKTVPQREGAEVSYYQGREGLKKVLDLIIEEGKDNYWLGSLDSVFRFLSQDDFYKRLTVRRMKQNTKSYAITNRKSLQNKKFSETLGNFRQFKVLPDGLDFPSAGLQLFGDYIAIGSHTDKDLNIVLIKDEKMASLAKLIFNLLWKNLKSHEI